MRGSQREMITKMMRPKRRQGECDDEFFPRINHNISNAIKVIKKYEVCAWDIRAKEYYFRWAGQVARAQQYNTERLTYKAMQYKNIANIKAVALRNGGNQGHGRPVYVWRWETDLYKSGETYGNCWQDLPGNVSEWNGGYLDIFRNFELINSNMKVRGHKRKRPR